MRNSNSVFLNSQQVWDMTHITRFLHLGGSLIIHSLKALKDSDLMSFLYFSNIFVTETLAGG